MNITDTVAPEATEDRLEMIFNRQRELMIRYKEIEEKSGIGKAVLNGEPFNVDRPRSQQLCKDFAWRVTEELAESTEAYDKGETLHAQEECADALHFLVELLLISGNSLIIPPQKGKDLLESSFVVAGQPRPPHAAAYEVVMTLGLAMNCLKQKPWKQTHMATDQKKFAGYLNDSFLALIRFARAINISASELFDLYFRKSNVNEFRQRSQY